jgi:hypothetical protein
MNYLYVINAYGTRFYKVGITEQPIEQRLANLQTGNALRLVVVRVYSGLGARHIEAEVHTILARYRVRPDGEWFQLESPAMVDRAVEMLGHRRHWLLSLPLNNLPSLLKYLARMVIDAVLFGNQQNKRKSAKLGKTYR